MANISFIDGSFWQAAASAAGARTVFATLRNFSAPESAVHYTVWDKPSGKPDKTPGKPLPPRSAVSMVLSRSPAARDCPS